MEENNLALYERARNVPEEAKKTIAAGRLKGFTDISPMWRIRKLTEEFGPCGIGWYYRPVRKWVEHVGEEAVAFVDISLHIKVGGEWSQEIAGTGGSKLAAKEKSGLFVSDECYKMATTDALSVACKQLGIGADVYWDKDPDKYTGRDERGDEKDRKINEEEKKLLKQAAERTGMNLDKAIESRGGKSVDQVTLSAYTKWMSVMAVTETYMPPAPVEFSEEIPQEIDEETPFR